VLSRSAACTPAAATQPSIGAPSVFDRGPSTRAVPGARGEGFHTCRVFTHQLLKTFSGTLAPGSRRNVSVSPAVKRPPRPYKIVIQQRFSVENAKGA
jgi:hypothetical protein